MPYHLATPPGRRVRGDPARPLRYLGGSRASNQAEAARASREPVSSVLVKWLALLAGGGLGAVLRFSLALWVDGRAGIHFPWGTLAVNVCGCFAIGVVATLADEHALVSPTLRLFLVTGLLGGFTTFSAFGMETWQLLEDGRALAALANGGGSVLAGLAAVVAGVAITRSVLGSV